MEYPLHVSFKIATFGNRFSVTDNSGNIIFYVKQKMFKLKEAIKVFMEESQTDQLYSINADRIIDFSGRYHFSDIGGQNLGSVKRKGRRSLWRAHYQINDPQNQVMTISEESVFTRFMDGMIPDICSGE